MFDDRDDAARRLAAALAPYAPDRPLVLAIPRGAVPMGLIVAQALGGDLDVVLVRKLRAPGNPELAVGAIDESGWAFVADHAESVGARHAWLEREKHEQLALLAERRRQYTPWRGRHDAAGRVAIVIDDGLATGSTMIAALHSVRARNPRRLVCAVPVASREALDRISEYADDVVCLDVPRWFGAVGEAYRRFDQVGDDEVTAILHAESVRRAEKPAA